jgi:two-component system nitrate/nitrite response regulator NarL
VTRAVIVDDHRLLAQSIALALRLEGIDCSVAALDDRDALMHELTGDPPDVVLLDLDLGGSIGDGTDLVGPLSSAGVRVLVLSASNDPVRLGAALEAGAMGVLSKTEPIDVLLAAAASAARGEPAMSETRRRDLLLSAVERRVRRAVSLEPFDRLSERESEVLCSLALAAQAHVSEATVRSQVRGVLTKLGVGSQLEAVAKAHSSGWLAAGPSALPLGDLLGGSG